MLMRFNFYKQACLVKVFYHCFSCCIAVHPLVFSAVFIDRTVVVEHLNLFQIVPHSNFKVVRVVSRGNFHSACSKFFIHIFIRYHRNFPVHKRQYQLLSNQMRIPFILRIDRHSGISKQSLRTRGRNYQRLVAVFDHVFDIPKITVFFLIFHFSV